ncbi:xanthine dehydrogenase family protein [Treponema sp.]|uniref:xanthine dehydrogenase family protein molybdopterin-binding subunit n=1 Tax=Treponema sp. TaxID=166 RepID=UPI00298E97F4|nr:xanthine dehydrogenase family protein [Treponema sp.]MCQ2242498.1 xanthine dehydrogenase family protein molybdopterin-binding subunit [Treponema sp.]
MSKKVTAARTLKFSFQKEFYSDLTMDGMLYAVTVRSPAKEGIIKSISHPDLPEGYTLVTARDIPGTNLIDTPNGKIPVFCEGNISYEGEPLGLLVGPDETTLHSLVEELEITVDTNTIEDYLQDEDLLAAGNLEDPEKKVSKRQLNQQKKEIEALKEIKEEFFSNKLAERTLKFGPCWRENDKGEIPGIESIFSAAPHVLEKDWTYAFKTTDYGEPNGALCFWNEEILTILTPTQWLGSLRSIVSETMAIEPENINLKKTTSTNRGTNSIWYNSILACQVAAAANKCKKPVKLVFTRKEQDKFLNTIQPINIVHKTAINEEGKLLAMKVNMKVDAGFANPFAQEIIDRLCIASCGIYCPENILIEATATSSHKPASSVDIQLIDTAAFYAVENQMNLVCQMCNLTPLEFRLLNKTAPSDSKNRKTWSPFQFSLNKITEALEAVAQKSDFNRKYASYHLDSSDWKMQTGPKEYVSLFSSPMRGIGLACAYEGTGYYGSEVYESAQSLEVTLEENSTITILCPPVSPSIQEICTRTVSEILDIPPSSVNFNSTFKNGDEPPLPENVYSSISIMTSLLKKCCLAIKKRKPSDKLPFTVKRKVTAAQKKEWDHQEFKGKPFHSTSFIAAILELEINPCTYREYIRSISIVADGGKILNTQAASASIKLAVQRTLERLYEDDRIEYPQVKISFCQSENDSSQIGELVYQVIPAAFTQALTQALNCTINSIPLKTDTIFNKIKEQKALLRKISEAQAIAKSTDSDLEKKEQTENENSIDAE